MSKAKVIFRLTAKEKTHKDFNIALEHKIKKNLFISFLSLLNSRLDSCFQNTIPCELGLISRKLTAKI